MLALAELPTFELRRPHGLQSLDRGRRAAAGDDRRGRGLSMAAPDASRPAGVGPGAAASAGRRRQIVGRVLGYLGPYRGRGGLALLVVLAQSLLSIVPILAIRAITNHLTHPHASFGPVLLIVALAFGATVLSGLLGVAETYLTVSLSERVVADLRSGLFDHLVGQSVAYFTRNRAGDVMSRILNDVEAVDNILGTTLLEPRVERAHLGRVDRRDGLPELAADAFDARDRAVRRTRAAAAAGVRYTTRASACRESSRELTAYLRERLDLSAMMLTKSFGRERRERARFAELNRSLRDREIEAGMATQWITMALRTLQVIGPAVMLLAGGYLVSEGELSLGSLLAFSIVAIRFAGTAQEAAGGALHVAGSLAPWRRIFETLDEPFDVQERADARALAGVRGAIELDGVSFAYAGQERPALREVSARIEPGQLAALVGPSGAGKTTFSQLVPRFYDPQAGAVRIDGHDVRELTFASLAASRRARAAGHLPVPRLAAREPRLRAPRRERRARCSRLPRRRTSRACSRGCPKASTPSSASAGTGSAAARSSAWRSRA